ncbi:MAG TPA: universal stress protein [Burkholderiaceae bacterium]|nr:universal stress protein [Burkholderiaceae bacterium]
MLSVLLAVDGSENALRATRELIASAALYKEALHVELVTVRPPLPLGGFSGLVLSREMIDGYYREEGERALASSRRLLVEAGIDCTPRVLVGDIPHMLVEHAASAGCRMMFMGTRGMAQIPGIVLGSISTKVLHLARIPVTLVP